MWISGFWNATLHRWVFPDVSRECAASEWRGLRFVDLENVKYRRSVNIRELSSILVVLESCHQNCMTYTSAECAVGNS